MKSHTSKASNPKEIIGSDKLPLHLWPTTATALGCLGMLNGALKYGRSNYRVVGARASTYVAACQRHLSAWFEGEECDPDDGVPHLAAALSCLAILADAQAAGKLRDDRMTPIEYRQFIDGLTAHVPRLKQQHASRHLRHYSREDVISRNRVVTWISPTPYKVNLPPSKITERNYELRATKHRILVYSGLLNGFPCKLWGRTDWTAGRGEGRLAQRQDPCVHLEVSMDCAWEECVDSLLHETVELILLSNALSTRPEYVTSQHISQRTFAFSHPQFTEAMSAAACFLTPVLTAERPLEKLWCLVNNHKIAR